MIRLAALLLLIPLSATAHPADLPHVHMDDPTLLMGMGAIAILAMIAIVVKGKGL